MNERKGVEFMEKKYLIKKNVNSDEEEVIDIYRHLSGKNKCLIRRTIKNLDTYYSNDPILQGYFWCDSPVKILCYTHEESDLINSFRALDSKKQCELLNELHIQITNYPLNYANFTKLTAEEKNLIDDYRDLNVSGRRLINESMKTYHNMLSKYKRKRNAK